MHIGIFDCANVQSINHNVNAVPAYVNANAGTSMESNPIPNGEINMETNMDVNMDTNMDTNMETNAQLDTVASMEVDQTVQAPLINDVFFGTTFENTVSNEELFQDLSDIIFEEMLRNTQSLNNSSGCGGNGQNDSSNCSSNNCSNNSCVCPKKVNNRCHKSQTMNQGVTDVNVNHNTTDVNVSETNMSIDNPNAQPSEGTSSRMDVETSAQEDNSDENCSIFSDMTQEELDAIFRNIENISCDDLDILWQLILPEDRHKLILRRSSGKNHDALLSPSRNEDPLISSSSNSAVSIGLSEDQPMLPAPSVTSMIPLNDQPMLPAQSTASIMQLNDQPMLPAQLTASIMQLNDQPMLTDPSATSMMLLDDQPRLPAPLMAAISAEVSEVSEVSQQVEVPMVLDHQEMPEPMPEIPQQEVSDEEQLIYQAIPQPRGLQLTIPPNMRSRGTTTLLLPDQRQQLQQPQQLVQFPYYLQYQQHQIQYQHVQQAQQLLQFQLQGQPAQSQQQQGQLPQQQGQQVQQISAGQAQMTPEELSRSAEENAQEQRIMLLRMHEERHLRDKIMLAEEINIIPTGSSTNNKLDEHCIRSNNNVIDQQRRQLQQLQLQQLQQRQTQRKQAESDPKKTNVRRKKQQPPITPNEYPRPSYSYSCLIAMALKNSDTGALPVNQIYKFILRHFPFYQTACPSWKNSVRHNLSLNKNFDKVARPPGVPATRKGTLWGISLQKYNKICDEILKWSQKDEKNIRLSMQRPEDLKYIQLGMIKYAPPRQLLEVKAKQEPMTPTTTTTSETSETPETPETCANTASPSASPSVSPSVSPSTSPATTQSTSQSTTPTIPSTTPPTTPSTNTSTTPTTPESPPEQEQAAPVVHRGECNENDRGIKRKMEPESDSDEEVVQICPINGNLKIVSMPNHKRSKVIRPDNTKSNHKSEEAKDGNTQDKDPNEK